MSTVEEKESRELDHGHRFYQRMAELQEKLRKSEEERLKLEENFKTLMRTCREEEDAKLTMLKAKYEKFLDEEKKRRERNDRILQTLDRIESRTVMLTSKSERLQLMRRHYEAYLASMYPAWTDSHQGQITNKSKMSPANPNSRYAKLTSDSNKDIRFPLTPVKSSVYTPSYLSNPAMHQRLSAGYSSTQPLVNTRPLESLGLSQQSPHQEYSLPGHNLTPSYASSPYQQFSPYNQPMPESFSSRTKTLPSQYAGDVPIFSPPNLKHQERFQSSPPEKLNPYSHHLSSAQNTSHDLYGNPLFSDSFKFGDKYTLPSSANTVEENRKILQNDESNIKKSDLSDCISNAADLLNYKLKEDHGPLSMAHHGVEESKLAMSVDNELEQNTSGDPLCMSLSDDGILNQEEALNNESLLEATGGREVSNRMEMTPNTFGVLPVGKETTLDNSCPLLEGVKAADIKQGVEFGTPVVTGQDLNTVNEKKAEIIGETGTSNSDNDLTNIDCMPATTNVTNVQVRPRELGQGDAVEVVKGIGIQEAEYGLSNVNNEGNEIGDKLTKEHTSEQIDPQNKVGVNLPENLGTEDVHPVATDPVNDPLASNNNESSSDGYIRGEELNSEQVGDVIEEQVEGSADSGQGYVENVQEQVYEGQQQQYGIDNSNYVTDQAYVEQEYAADNGQGYVEDGQGNENNYVSEQVYDEHQQEYLAEGQEYVEDGQAYENNFVEGQVYGQQQRQEYEAVEGQGYVEGGPGNENNYVEGQAYDGQQQGYVEGGQSNENNYVEGQAYDGQQQEYEAVEGQGYVEGGQAYENNYVEGQVYDQQQQHEYEAVEGQGYVEGGQGNENNYAEGQVYDGQQQQEYGTVEGQGYENNYTEGQAYNEQQQEYEGQGYVEGGQGNENNYAEGQAYDGHQQQEYATVEGQGNENNYAEGQAYEEPHVADGVASENRAEDQQYFQGGKYHEPTAGYETGNVTNSEEDGPGGAELSNETSTDSISKLPQAEQENTPDSSHDPASNKELHQGQNSKLLDESRKSRDTLDNSENITSTTSSEFNKQSDSNELESDVNPVKVSVDGDGTRMADGNPSKPKIPGLAMLESDSESAVLDTVGMPNDDSDFDFSENK